MPFQNVVNVVPAPAVEGDFASANPRWAVLAGPGALVAGAGGLTVGRFAWLDPSGRAVNTGFGPVVGFVHRDQVALITNYLGEASMVVPAGFEVTLFSAGDFWARNNGTTPALVGMKAFADYTDGHVSFAASGSPPSATVTGSIAASTASVTGSISDNVLTVTAVGSGALVVGGTLSGTGIVSGTMITAQLTGTTGGIGTYRVSVPEQSVASTTITETYGTFTVTAVSSGIVEPGDVLSGTGITSGTYITALGTGSGGNGTYIVSPTQTASSTTVTLGTSVETKWYAMTPGLPGELVKISSQPLG